MHIIITTSVVIANIIIAYDTIISISSIPYKIHTMLLFTQPIDANYSNLGVRLGVGEHSARVLGEYRTNWLQALVKMNAFKVAIFDGPPVDAGGAQGLVIARIDNLKIITTNDHGWTTGMFHNVHHREIAYTIKGNLIVEGFGQAGTPPDNLSPASTLPGGATNW